MKIKSKSVKVVNSAPKAGVKTERASLKQVAAKLVDRFYVLLRGTPLKLAALRKADFKGQTFGPALAGGSPAIVVATGTYGTAVSTVTAKKTVVAVDKTRSFDMQQVPGALVLGVKEAAQHFKKHGAAHVIKQGKAEMKGYLLGSLENPYVAFFNEATKQFKQLRTTTISDGRGGDEVFSLVK